MQEYQEKDQKARQLADLIQQLENATKLQQETLENKIKTDKTIPNFTIQDLQAENWEKLENLLKHTDGLQVANEILKGQGYKLLAQKFMANPGNVQLLKCLQTLSESSSVVCSGLFPLIVFGVMQEYLKLQIRPKDKRNGQGALERELLLTILLNLTSNQPTAASNMIPGLMPLQTPNLSLHSIKHEFPGFHEKLERDILIGLKQDVHLDGDSLVTMEELDIQLTDGTSPLLLLFILQNIYSEPSIETDTTPEFLPSIKSWLEKYIPPPNHLHTYKTEMVLALLNHITTRAPKLKPKQPSDLVPSSLPSSCPCIKSSCQNLVKAWQPSRPNTSRKCSNIGCPNREPVPGMYTMCSCKETLYCTVDCQWEHFEEKGHVSIHSEQEVAETMQALPLLIQAYQGLQQGKVDGFDLVIESLNVKEGTPPKVCVLSMAVFAKTKALIQNATVSKDVLQDLQLLLNHYPTSGEALYLSGQVYERLNEIHQAIKCYYAALQVLRWHWQRKEGDITMDLVQEALIRTTSQLLGVSPKVTKTEMGRPDIGGLLMITSGKLDQDLNDGTGGSLLDHTDPTTLESASRLFILFDGEMTWTRDRLILARRLYEEALMEHSIEKLAKALLTESRSLTIDWSEFHFGNDNWSKICKVFRHEYDGKEVDILDLSDYEKASLLRAQSDYALQHGDVKGAVELLQKARSITVEWQTLALLARAAQMGQNVDANPEDLLKEYLERLKTASSQLSFGGSSTFHPQDELEYSWVTDSLSRLYTGNQGKLYYQDSISKEAATKFLWRKTLQTGNDFFTGKSHREDNPHAVIL